MCVFCKIVSGEYNCFKLYEDDLVLAYLDINPDTNGHTLVIPKEHFKDLDDIDETVLNHLLSCVRDLKKMLEDKLHCDGITLVQNNGSIQEVKHFHMHIKPYYIDNKVIKPVEEIYEILKKEN